jgi:hypothetical protein
MLRDQAQAITPSKPQNAIIIFHRIPVFIMAAWTRFCDCITPTIAAKLLENPIIYIFYSIIVFAS